MTSIGKTVGSPFGARVADGHSCRYPPTSVKLSQSICALAVRTVCRHVFLRHRAPIHGFSHSITVSTIVRRALIRTGIDSARKGAHLFRHTLATDLLRKGASLDEIGELLRHSSPNTTALYAKVGLTAWR